MNARKTQPLRIDYPIHWFVILTIVFESVIVWLFFTAYANAADNWKVLWLVVSPLTGLLIGLFLVPPMLTHHLAGERSLRLRMGLLINETVPYSWIKEVKQTSVHRGGLRVGIGVRYFHISRILFVTSAFSSLVTMKLDGQHDMGRFRKKQVEEIVISVRYASPVIDTLRGRIGVPKGD